MHELAFADAARPTPVVVLNIPLKEFSLGHALLLFRRRNPLALLSQTDFAALPLWQQIAAIKEMAWVCSDAYSERDAFERPGAFCLAFRWNEWKRRRWAAQLKHLQVSDYELAEAELRNYLAEAQAMPPMPGKFASLVLGYRKDPPGRQFGQPLLLTLYLFVLTLPASARPLDAWDFPFALAIWLFYAECESKGAFKIENYRESRLQEEENRHLQDIEAEQKAAAEAVKTDTEAPAAENPPLPAGLATPPPGFEPGLEPDLRSKGGA